MAEEQKPTREEFDKEMEKKRKVALENLKGNVGNLAAVYLIENSGQFGEADSAAVEQFVYNPSLSMDELKAGLRSSRHGGKRYTGSVSEYQILEQAAGIMQQSLPFLKLNDFYELMGAGTKEDGNVYLGEMPEEKAKQVAGMYQNYLMFSRASKATGEVSKKIPGDLEKLLKESGKEKKEE
jgi:hypothetical protein